MSQIPNLTEDQKNFLSLLYDKKKPLSKKELQSYSSNFSISEALSLIDSNPNLVCLLGKGGYNEHVKITPEGKAVVEAIRKQNSDEIYKLNFDKESIDIAKEANKKADKSIKIAIWSIIISILIDFIPALFNFFSRLFG